MREYGQLRFYLAVFLGFFISILLGSDYHTNDANLDGQISIDKLHVEDSLLSIPVVEPWKKYNFHPNDRFHRNKLSTMTNSVRHPTIHRPNDWKVLSTTSYTILVGGFVDGEVMTDGCSTSSKLSTCNVRSAWAYCISLISQQSCGNNAAVTCTVVLPSNSTSVMNGNYKALNLSTLTSWATSCTLTQVSLSVVGSVTGGLAAWVRGDSSSSAFIDAESVPFLTLTLSDLNIAGFGDGTTNFLSAVVVSALQGSVFQRLSFHDNLGYSTGSAVYGTSMGPMLITACVFINNKQVLYTRSLLISSNSQTKSIIPFLLLCICTQTQYISTAKCSLQFPPFVFCPTLSRGSNSTPLRSVFIPHNSANLSYW